MLLDNYRREMEQMGPSGAQMDRLLDRMEHAEPAVKRAFPRTVLIAAALCGVMAVGAIALSPTLRDTLEALLGSFAPYSQTVEGISATDQGIQISARKSLADESGGVIYLEVKDLTGDRLTADTQFENTYPMITPIDYDPETHTLLARTGWTAGNDIRDEEGNVVLSIGQLWGGVGLWDKGIVLPTELLEPDNVMETLVLPEEKRRGTDDDGVVLVPEQTPMALEGTDLITLSSAGFDGRGRLHVQVKAAEGAVIPPYSFYVDLPSVHAIIDEMGLDEPYFSLQGQTHTLEEGRYVDFTVLPIVYNFDLTGADRYTYLPKELYQGQRVVLSGWVGTREKVKGDWTLRFPIETLSSRTLTVDQVVNTKRVESLTLSARSVTLRLTLTNGQRGHLMALPLTVYLADGSHITVERGTCAHYFEEDEPYYLDTWEFPDPIDPAEVTACSIAYWYIPLEGDTAQPGRWLETLP